MRTPIREHKKCRLNGRLRRCLNTTFFMEDELLQVCSSMFCLSSPSIPISIVHTAKIEIKQCLKDHEEVVYKRLKPMEIIKPSDPNSVVAVAHRRWSFTRGTNWERFGVLVRWSLTKSSHSHRLDYTIYSLESALCAEL